MDTKISQDIQAASDTAGSFDKRQPFWSSLIIRTMQQDLAAAGAKPGALPTIPKPIAATPKPVPAISVSAPTPTPVPAPAPVKISVPKTIPTPTPISTSKPTPTPTPVPAPAPVPASVPKPVTTPIPKPTLTPALTPTPKPTPAPAVPAAPRHGGAVRPELVSSLDLTPKKKAAPVEGGINWKKTILIVVILVAVFFSVGLWFILRQPAPATTPSPSPSASISVSPGVSKAPSPSPSPTTLPLLFEVEKQATITLTSAQENLAGQKIRQQFIQSSETAGIFTRIVLKIANGEESTLGFKRIVSALNLSFFGSLIPSANATSSFGDYYLKSDQSFLLFIYTQAPADSSPFSGSQNEGRAGLAMEFKDSVDLAVVSQSLKNIESSLLRSAGVLFLNENISLPATVNFSNNIYREIPIRYFNITGPGLSFDYAFVGRKLLITTSRESMYAAIDRLLAK